MNSRDFAWVRELVLKQTGVALPEDKEYLAEARLAPVAREVGAGSLDELFRLLRFDEAGELAERVADAMLTRETSFFRDVHPFETLRAHVLPQLVEARRSERRLRIWCAACSTGQEPYSLALLIHERFPELLGWSVELIASDISRPTLERARAGRYGKIEINRGLPARMLTRHFEQRDGEWLLRDEIRRCVEFKRINLNEPWPALPLMDLILLRNVLIYFPEHGKKRILGLARDLLRPDGHLLLGAAETPLLTCSDFEPAPVGNGFYRRKEP